MLMVPWTRKPFQGRPSCFPHVHCMIYWSFSQQHAGSFHMSFNSCQIEGSWRAPAHAESFLTWGHYEQKHHSLPAGWTILVLRICLSLGSRQAVVWRVWAEQDLEFWKPGLAHGAERWQCINCTEEASLIITTNTRLRTGILRCK